jgi:transcriptional regulator with XRE-family HTH domain
VLRETVLVGFLVRTNRWQAVRGVSNMPRCAIWVCGSGGFRRERVGGQGQLRKEKGFTQVELAEKVGMIQALISDYERDKLRPYADVVARFAAVLGVSSDELLGLARAEKRNGTTANRRLLRRLEAIDRLPKRDQDALLRTIDAFLGKQRAS